MDQLRIETIEAGRHGRMCREQVPGTGHGQRDVERLPGITHETASTLQNRESRMTFVQMTHFRVDAKQVQQPPAADAQYQFLLQAGFRAAAIQFAGNSSINRIIRRIVAIEQIQVQATDLDLPGAQPDRVAGQIQLKAQPFTVGTAQRGDRQLTGIVEWIHRLLRAMLIDHLTKIALRIQ